ncbi:zinc finger protein OZF-like isoform X1 [Thalassophryne amazonica]|uniref:zinc finger protein OZF-like isoform X1 n=1 Tax=Thalassophryne amazonica TaxID=390379 RepID=UPI001471EA28|nr:zinc finger protein OZF-like isoform X1 [Thalassophryne amazonica]
MSKVQMLRALVKQRLTAAAEEIFGLFERTIAEYEEELCRSKEENHRQRHLLDTVFNPDVHLQAADVHHELLMRKNEVPSENQHWCSNLDLENSDSPQRKVEQGDLWTKLETVHPPAVEEAHIKQSTWPQVLMKSEDDEDKLSSEGHQSQTEAESRASMKTECDEADSGGLEPETNLHPDAGEKISDPKQSGKVGTNNGNKTRECDSGLNTPTNINILVTDRKHNTVEKPFDCSECKLMFRYKSILNRHMKIHSGEKPFSCAECPKRFLLKSNLQKHMMIHTGEKPYVCPICGARYNHSTRLTEHIRSHTGEKPFICSVCNKSFGRRSHLTTHMHCHAKEKPFSCSVCGKTFTQSSNLSVHKRIHSGIKPFSCSVCSKGFTQKTNLISHMSVHSGQKLYRCNVCGKGFNEKCRVRKHKCLEVSHFDRLRPHLCTDTGVMQSLPQQ